LATRRNGFSQVVEVEDGSTWVVIAKVVAFIVSKFFVLLIGFQWVVIKLSEVSKCLASATRYLIRMQRLEKEKVQPRIKSRTVRNARDGV
jgi:hypothetical protein